MLRLIATLLLAITATVSNAQTVTDSYRADMKELLDTTGSLKMAEQLSNVLTSQMINSLKARNPQFTDKAATVTKEVISKFFTDFMYSAETLDAFASAYAKRFSQDEIKELVAFYKSPLGSKVAAKQSEIAAETQAYVQSRLPVLIPQLQGDMMKRFATEGLPPPQ